MACDPTALCQSSVIRPFSAVSAAHSLGLQKDGTSIQGLLQDWAHSSDAVIDILERRSFQ